MPVAGNVREPLLSIPPDHVVITYAPSNFWLCVANLTKAALGVGLMALPRACALLGLWPGISMMVVVGLLTYATLSQGILKAYGRAIARKDAAFKAHTHNTAALPQHQVSMDLDSWANGHNDNGDADQHSSAFARASRSPFDGSDVGEPPAPSRSPSLMRTESQAAGTRNMTYPEVVEDALGKGVADTLMVFLAACTFGYIIMFIDVIGDSLLGEPNLPGILVDLWKAMGLGDEVTAWLLWRPLVLGVLVLLGLLPLCIKRNLSAVNGLNLIGLISLAGFGMSLMWLAGAAVYSGQAHTPKWGLDLPALGVNGLARLLSILSIMPILITADSCHQNVLPLALMQHPFSIPTMDRVVSYALAIVTAFYLLTAFSSYVVFGEALSGDVLTNLAVPALTPLVGPAAAALISYTVRIGYVLSLVGSAVLNMFPLRQALSGMIFSELHKKAMLRVYFVPITVLLLAASYLIAVFVPSMWIIISFVGGVGSTFVCFIIPGLLMLPRMHRKHPEDSTQAADDIHLDATVSTKKWNTTDVLTQFTAVIVITLGVILMAKGLLTPFLAYLPGEAVP